MAVDWYYQFRIILLGDSEVGKTSLVRRYTEGTFERKQDGTSGVDFYAKMLKLAPGVRRVKLQMWDTSGQQHLLMGSDPEEKHFSGITRTHFRNIVGVLLVFDLTTLVTFTNLNVWYMEAQSFLPERAIFMLVGQKSDKEAANRVPTERAAAWAASMGMAYVETSAKSNLNVDHVFQTLATSIYDAVTHNALGNDHLNPGNDWEDVKVVYKIKSCPTRMRMPEKSCLCQ